MTDPNKTYTSKFAPGETVWIMRDNRPQSYQVGSLTIKVSEIHVSIKYAFRIEEGGKFKEWIEIYECECFATKTELLASF